MLPVVGDKRGICSCGRQTEVWDVQVAVEWNDLALNLEWRTPTATQTAPAAPRLDCACRDWESLMIHDPRVPTSLAFFIETRGTHAWPLGV